MRFPLAEPDTLPPIRVLLSFRSIVVSALVLLTASFPLAAQAAATGEIHGRVVSEVLFVAVGILVHAQTDHARRIAFLTRSASANEAAKISRQTRADVETD